MIIVIITIIIVIIIIEIRVANSTKNNSNNSIVVIIEIRIGNLQGASHRMGSLHHIQVTGSDNEGTTIIIIQINTICDCIFILSTRVLPYLFAMERVLHPSTCQMPIKPLHTIPTVAQKAVDGTEEGHQEQLPSLRCLESQPRHLPRLKE